MVASLSLRRLLRLHLIRPRRHHPNAAGAKRMADTLWKHLETMIRVTGVRAAQNGG